MYSQSSEAERVSLRSARLRWKTRCFAAFIILSNSFGNLFLFLGMRQTADVTQSPLAMLRAIFQPQVMLGIALLICWMLARMMMMSWADLTYVLPVTAFGYVVTAALGYLFRGEVITPQRWIGTLMIVTGTVLVGLGNPHEREQVHVSGGPS